MQVRLFGSMVSRLPLLGALTITAVLAGCSGTSSGTNSLTVAHVRDYNAIPDSTTAVVSVGSNSLPGAVTSNNGTVTNGQGFLQASPYTSISISTVNVTFSLTSNSGMAYPPASQAFAGGIFYSAILFGRAGITSSADPRFPVVRVVTDDRTAPPVNNARLRIVQAASDAGNVDVLINGQVAASNIPYQNVGSYLNEAAGDLTVQVNKAGTNTVLVPATTETVTAGQLYTLLVVEPFLTPSPAYSLQLQSDAS